MSALKREARGGKGKDRGSWSRFIYLWRTHLTLARRAPRVPCFFRLNLFRNSHYDDRALRQLHSHSVTTKDA